MRIKMNKSSSYVSELPDFFPGDEVCPSVLEEDLDDSFVEQEPVLPSLKLHSKPTVQDIKRLLGYINIQLSLLEKYMPDYYQHRLRLLLEEILLSAYDAAQKHPHTVYASLEPLHDLLEQLNHHFKFEREMFDQPRDNMTDIFADHFKNFNQAVKQADRGHRFFRHCARFLISTFCASVGATVGTLAGISLGAVLFPLTLGMGTAFFASAGALSGGYLGHRLGAWLASFSSREHQATVEINFGRELENCIHRLKDPNGLFKFEKNLQSMYHADIKVQPETDKGDCRLILPDKKTAKDFLDRLFSLSMISHKKSLCIKDHGKYVSIFVDKSQLKQMQRAVSIDQANAAVFEAMLADDIVPASNAIGEMFPKILTNITARPSLRGYLISFEKKNINKDMLTSLAVLFEMYQIDYEWQDDHLLIPVTGITMLNQKSNDIKIMFEKYEIFKRKFKLEKIEYIHGKVVLNLSIFPLSNHNCDILLEELKNTYQIDVSEKNIARHGKVMISKCDFERLLLNLKEEKIENGLGSEQDMLDNDVIHTSLRKV